MLLKSTLFIFLMYFSMISRSNEVATLLVIMMIILLLKYMKSTKVSDLIYLSYWLMLAIYTFDCVMILSILFDSIGMIICFLESPLVIMLIFGLLFWFELFMTLCISDILSKESLGNASLIFNIHFMLSLYV